jgi:hypothetical protein
MEPWYKVVEPRKEVREGRSFNPDEFAIALEQVVAGTAPADYCDPKQFFARTCFTSAFREHVGMALRRLSGETANVAPVLALITQFGGGKTHTLTALYHLVKNSKKSADAPGISELLKQAGLREIPQAKVAVFVGNAWDPEPGKETPWLDIARQLAGEKGVAALGKEAKTKAPGTTNLSKLFEATGGHALILCDEVLNFLSRHRDRADAFHDFLSNLVRAMTGAPGCTALVSLPQSKPEMKDWDLRWQDIIVHEVGRVAKQLISNDESEISEVVRRRLFKDLGDEGKRRKVCRAYADWCFENRAQLPSEWTAVDTALTEKKVREYLQGRFESCYPFHPATLSVFQRKWQALPHYQQTRGTLAMLAQWISLAYRESFSKARQEPLITLGSAPLESRDFRGIVLGQLGEPKLNSAIETDIAGEHSKARALDADTKDVLRDIHRRVATAILFESSGGMKDKLAHLPELRFALGEPRIDTTTIDNAAMSLEAKAFFIKKVGSDGFQFRHNPTLRKVVNDRRAGLDEDKEIRPVTRNTVQREFERGATLSLVRFPQSSDEVADSPKLTLVVVDPDTEWAEKGDARKQIAEWTQYKGQSKRLYPASLVWCIRKPGRDLREKIELYLAWKHINEELRDGTLSSDFDKSELNEIKANLETAEDTACDEVWASYRYVVVADASEKDGLRPIDLGAGHASAGETLCGRVVAALKSESLLNESVGAGYIDRNWPPALQDSGAWPLSSLRQSFLNGSLTRLLDADATLHMKVVEFVGKGDFGLASGHNPDGTYERVWFTEAISPDEVAFESDVFLLRKKKAEELKKPIIVAPPPGPQPGPEPGPQPGPGPVKPGGQTRTVRLVGSVPPEVWNRIGTKLVPKLRSGKDLKIGVEFSVTVDAGVAQSLVTELYLILGELGLRDKVKIE